MPEEKIREQEPGEGKRMPDVPPEGGETPGREADELRAQVVSREAEIVTLKESVTELNTLLTEAVARYRDGVLRENPEIPPELVVGATIREVEASLAQARALVDAVRKNLTEQVPAGAPARTGADVEGLSSRQKIEYGIQRRK